MEDRCERCTICCYQKILKEDGSVVYTDRSCRYLDIDTGLCIVYEFRTAAKDDCVQISPKVIALGVLPEVCPYVRGQQGYTGPRLTEKLQKKAEEAFGKKGRSGRGNAGRDGQ
jgi:uncharacterized cysteine cluster protein YcgN (CxxCxxCC family)